MQATLRLCVLMCFYYPEYLLINNIDCIFAVLFYQIKRHYENR